MFKFKNTFLFCTALAAVVGLAGCSSSSTDDQKKPGTPGTGANATANAGGAPTTSTPGAPSTGGAASMQGQKVPLDPSK